VSRSEHLVRAVDLRRALAQRGSEASPGNERPPATGRPVLLLDVRWRLTDRAGADRERHAVGHLPGARFLDLEQVLTTHSDDPRDGRHPLPDVETLEHGLGALGVEVVDDVVVYDEPGSFAAARAWWVLRWAGIRARVLDGGLLAWVEIGGPLEAGDEVTWGATTPRLTPGHLPTLTADDAATRGQRAVLLDARAPERYRGEVEPLDPRAGHIPGAVNVPAAGLLTGSGTLLPDDELRAALGGLSASGDVAGILRFRGLCCPGRPGPGRPRRGGGALPGVVVGLVQRPAAAGSDRRPPRLSGPSTGWHPLSTALWTTDRHPSRVWTTDILACRPKGPGREPRHEAMTFSRDIGCGRAPAGDVGPADR